MTNREKAERIARVYWSDTNHHSLEATIELELDAIDAQETAAALGKMERAICTDQQQTIDLMHAAVGAMAPKTQPDQAEALRSMIDRDLKADALRDRDADEVVEYDADFEGGRA